MLLPAAARRSSGRSSRTPPSWPAPSLTLVRAGVLLPGAAPARPARAQPPGRVLAAHRPGRPAPAARAVAAAGGDRRGRRRCAGRHRRSSGTPVRARCPAWPRCCCRSPAALVGVGAAAGRRWPRRPAAGGARCSDNGGLPAAGGRAGRAGRRLGRGRRRRATGGWPADAGAARRRRGPRGGRRASLRCWRYAGSRAPRTSGSWRRPRPPVRSPTRRSGWSRRSSPRWSSGATGPAAACARRACPAGCPCWSARICCWSRRRPAAAALAGRRHRPAGAARRTRPAWLLGVAVLVGAFVAGRHRHRHGRAPTPATRCCCALLGLSSRQAILQRLLAARRAGRPVGGGRAGPAARPLGALPAGPWWVLGLALGPVGAAARGPPGPGRLRATTPAAAGHPDGHRSRPGRCSASVVGFDVLLLGPAGGDRDRRQATR